MVTTAAVDLAQPTTSSSPPAASTTPASPRSPARSTPASASSTRSDYRDPSQLLPGAGARRRRRPVRCRPRSRDRPGGPRDVAVRQACRRDPDRHRVAKARSVASRSSGSWLTTCSRCGRRSVADASREIRTRRRPAGARQDAPTSRAAGVHRTDARTIGSVDGQPQLEDGTVLDVANVVWCTGFRQDFGVHPPLGGRRRRLAEGRGRRGAGARPGSTSWACSSSVASTRCSSAGPAGTPLHRGPHPRRARPRCLSVGLASIGRAWPDQPLPTRASPSSRSSRRAAARRSSVPQFAGRHRADARRLLPASRQEAQAVPDDAARAGCRSATGTVTTYTFGRTSTTTCSPRSTAPQRQVLFETYIWKGDEVGAAASSRR